MGVAGRRQAAKESTSKPQVLNEATEVIPLEKSNSAQEGARARHRFGPRFPRFWLWM